MTWEEMELTMDFIVRQQAQFEINHQKLEADLQREHDERIHDKPRIARVEACMVTLTELAEIQSRRIDRNERTAQENMRSLAAMHFDIMAHLGRILDRLSDKN